MLLRCLKNFKIPIFDFELLEFINKLIKIKLSAAGDGRGEVHTSLIEM